jgi:hypothetical protein
MTFTSYADPFTQQTQVGGSGPSLQANDNGNNPSSWLFSVSATDADGRNTTAKEPFSLVVYSH